MNIESSPGGSEPKKLEWTIDEALKEIEWAKGQLAATGAIDSEMSELNWLAKQIQESQIDPGKAVTRVREVLVRRQEH